jgi:hypothetical protein
MWRNEMLKIAYSPRAAADAAGVGLNKIYGWMNDLSLPAKKDNGRTLITDDALRAKITSLPDYEPQAHDDAAA